MPVTRVALTGLGGAVLAAVWLGPLPSLAPQHFSAHMTMHMGVVAVAAPLLALGLARSRLDPARRWARPFSPIPASLVELIVVWGWHAPALHQAARSAGAALAAEQASFFIAAFALWVSAFSGGRADAAERSGGGVVGLLLTSMHMTLLGALIALSPRALYGHGATVAIGPASLVDQQLGGAIMLAVGGASYLAGGLCLAARLLGCEPRAVPAEGETT